MIRLTWQNLNDKIFLDALKKIADKAQELSVTNRFRLSVISQNVYLEMLKAQAAAKELLQKYAQKDEKGEIEGYPDASKIKFPSKEVEARHDEEFKQMLQKKFKIHSKGLEVSELGNIDLSMQELAALHPVLLD